MASVNLNQTPLAPGVSPIEIYYRDHGAGFPLVFLHGGWGYSVYPFDRQIEEFGAGHRILIPDRTGYGRSGRITDLPVDFHRRAAAETSGFLDALGIGRAVVWGHSDGAVIAVWMGLAEPERCAGLILEALHYYRAKPGSREFFDSLARRPELLGERVGRTLASEHGEDYWRSLIALGGRAWLAIADSASHPAADLFDGRLGEIAPPVLVVHGESDPRTEPGELDAARRALPRADCAVIDGAGHSPHSETRAFAACNRAVREFLSGITRRGGYSAGPRPMQ
ncbi:MAG: hypothetical protein DMG07_15935 [Acidobacteria bacterium]|nr:MAG: hypothetical protein DMG07_15935 [Acidobacteriota bacterium]